MPRAVVVTKMGWQVNEEVNRDETDEADEMNLEVDFKDKVFGKNTFVFLYNS